MVYSATSINPIEGEASVAEIIKRSSGVVKLVDVSQSFPHLLRRSGLTSWKVMTSKGDWYSTYDSIPEQYKQNKVDQSMWPPLNAKDLNLHRW